MGRTILVEENVQQCIANLYGSNEWMLGIIVGQITSQRDYVVHIVSTPIEETEEGINSKAKSLESINEKWVAAHAKQVLRMLPGGLDIMGIFALANPDVMKNSQAKLRQVLFAVNKSLVKNQIIPIPTDHSDRILLQICSITRKLTCRTFDVSDPKSTAKPADWKPQSFVDRWSRLDSCVIIDNMSVDITKEALTHGFDAQLKTGTIPYCTRIWNALGTVDGCLIGNDDLLTAASPAVKKQKTKSKDVPNSPCHKIDLLTQLNSKGSPPKLLDCGAAMLIRGTMTCRAYVNNKATVSEAIKAIKIDAIRSFSSRCELLCEEVMETEEDKDPKVLYETPMRIFLRLKNASVTFCDYLFDSENQQDLMDRLNELLGLEEDDIDIEKDAEHFPGEEDLLRPGEEVKSLETEIEDILGEDLGGLRKYVGAFASGAVALLVAGFSYFYMKQE